jgi:acetylornithine deacetylase/succinyl-diaminopimelate desuccinylase-like protein
VDPFAANIRDGYLYGRGSIDDKAMLAANIATMVELKRTGARLARDVIFLATDDEEQGGSASIKVTIQKYWDKIACAYALNEGGRVMVKDAKVQYVGVQASEKVAYNVTVTATGSSGHGSLPKPDNAVVHLAAAVEKLGTFQVPAQPSTITLRYFEQLAKVEKSPSGCARLSSQGVPTSPSSISLTKARCGTRCCAIRLRPLCCRPVSA